MNYERALSRAFSTDKALNKIQNRPTNRAFIWLGVLSAPRQHNSLQICVLSFPGVLAGGLNHNCTGLYFTEFYRLLM